MAFNTTDLLRAMEIISNSKNSALKLDKTIIAQITEVVDLETGEYKVQYEGNTFSAFSSVPTITYKVSDSVYIKIPQNDMSQRKIIEGISSGGKTLSGIVEQQTAVNPVGPTWDKFYKYPADSEYGIVAGVSGDPLHKNFIRQIYPSAGSVVTGDTGDAFFQDYSRKYKKIRFTASFMTRLVGQHTKGNYGLIVGFKVNTVDNTGIDRVYYRLDMSNFVGTPYNYTNWSPQSVIIDVQDNYLLGLDSIYLFQEDFELDTTYDLSGNIVYQNNGDDDIFNILVKDIELSFVELIDLTKDIYYLDIATLEGVSFITAADSLPLLGRLKYQGKDILSEKTCKCYWYRENPEVIVNHDLYDSIAGPRWQPITTNDFNELIVDASEVLYHTNYKLVVIYNGVTLSKEITLYRYNSQYDYELVQETDGETINLKIQNNNGFGDLKGDWYYRLPDSTYNLITSANGEEQKGKASIPINEYLLYTTVDFYCLVKNGNTTVSVEHITIRSSSDDSDVIVTYDGQDIYQYDANGDLAYQDTEVDRTLGAKVTWREGFGSAYKITWTAPDGIPLDNYKSVTNAYNPSNSMMQRLWVDSSNYLHYTIRQKYTLSYTANIITVTITTVDQHDYSFEKEILFLKDGDQGTNGSTFICAIRPIKVPGFTKEIEAKALAYNTSTNKWGSGLNLRCFVYRDGVLINDLSDYNLSYEWECGSQNKDALSINYITGYSNKEDCRVINGVGNLDVTGDYVIKVTITVRASGTAQTGRWDDNSLLYCQYPVDIATNSLNIAALTLELPSYVKYTAAGTDPSYQTAPLVCKRGTNNFDLSSTNEELFIIKNNEDGQPILKPVEKFLYRNGIAAIKCVYGSQYLLHPVMMYLNTYGNETINGWDGTTLDINEEGGYILAPQVGAGKKDRDGTFTGVIMGRQMGIQDNDVFGLYGYKEGISTFGLKEDGTAYIGASGEGQIIFDGRKHGEILSGNYVSSDGKEGMKIELTEGHIDAYNFMITSGNMTLDSAKQKFLFTLGEDGASAFRIALSGDDPDGKKTLFNVQSGKYYLRTEDFTKEDEDKEIKGQGTEIDLSSGKITSYKFTIKTPQMEIKSSNSDDDEDGDKGGRFLFKVGTHGSFKVDGPNQTLLSVAANDFYLQNDTFQREKKDSSGNIITQGSGTNINLSDGKITSYDFTIKTPALEIESSYDSGSKFEFDVKNGGSFIIKDGDKILARFSGSRTETTSKQRFLQSFNFTEASAAEASLGTNATTDADGDATDTGSVGVGVKLDLKDNGKLEAANFRIKTSCMDLNSEKQSFTFDLVKEGSTAKGIFRIRGYDSSNKLSNLFYVSSAGDYYLKSAEYTTHTTANTDTDTAVGDVKTGVKFTLSGNGKLEAANFRIKTNSMDLNSASNSFTFDLAKNGSTSNGTFRIRGYKKNSSGTGENVSSGLINLLYISGGTTYYLQSANYENKNNDEDADNGDLEKVTGMKINLSTGKIWAKNVELSGKIKASQGEIGNWTIKDGSLKAKDDEGSIYLSTNEIKFGDCFSVTKDKLVIKFNKEDEEDVQTYTAKIKAGAEKISITMTEDGEKSGQINFIGYNGQEKTVGSALSTYSYASSIETSAQKINLTVTGNTSSTGETTLNFAGYGQDAGDEKIKIYTTTQTKSQINIGIDSITLSVSGTTVTIKTPNETKSGSVNCYQKSETYSKSEVKTEINGISLSYSGNTITLTKKDGQKDTISNIATKSDITAGINGIKLSTTTNGNTSTISLYNGHTLLNSQTITITGFVKFTDLSTSGSTTINGANIQTGTLTADKIRLGGEMTVYQQVGSTTSGGALGFMTGLNGAGFTTDGIGIKSTSGAHCIATTSGTRISAGNSTSSSSLYVTSSGAYCNCNFSITGSLSVNGSTIDFSNYAKSSDLTDLAKRVTALETK